MPLGDDELKQRILTCTRKLHFLEEQIAQFGFHTPPHIHMEAEDTKTEIERLQAERQARRRRLEKLLRRVKGRVLSSERMPGEFDLDIVQSRGFQLVFLSALTGEPFTPKAVSKIIHEVMEYHSDDLDIKTTVWIEYQEAQKRFYLLRLMWRTWPRIAAKLDDRKALAYEEVEQWLGLSSSSKTGPTTKSVYATRPT